MEVRGAEAYLALALVKGKLRDPPPPAPPPKLLGPAHGVPDGKQDTERTVDAESPGNIFFFTSMAAGVYCGSPAVNPG